jgi:two-component system, NarL family, sensor histidine kinase DesK
MKRMMRRIKPADAALRNRQDGPELGGLEQGMRPFTFYPWLLVASGAALNVIQGKVHPAWAAGGGLAAFAVLYVAAIWLRIGACRHRAALVTVIMLGVLTVTMTAAFGGNMFALFPLLSITCGVVVPWTERQPPLPLLAVAGVACAGAVIAWRRHAPAGDVWSVLYGSVLAGVIVAVILRLVTVIRELQQARRELARIAVDEERLRFARDLHDLLGHTLSVMVVKAQAVRRLAARDPGLAAEQAADIETVGRQALTEVREAVTGYRGRGLARELEAARIALADAGLTAVIRQDGNPMPAEADALLGWVIREGVTNVIRHSGGRRCEIDVRHAEGAATAEIRDDGSGGPPAKLPSGGHGLDGLAERAAAAGGTLEAGPCAGGGYRLAVSLPAASREEVTA